MKKMQFMRLRDECREQINKGLYKKEAGVPVNKIEKYSSFILVMSSSQTNCKH